MSGATDPQVREAADDRTALVLIGMQILVPWWIREMEHWPAAERQHAAETAADLISSGADQIWQLDSRRRDIPQGGVTTALAQGLAALAYGPVGVTWPTGAGWAGNHWCTAPHPRCSNRETDNRAGAPTP